jgi:indolepyruvate ferredoxin oxidoreductase alpha subunit
MLSMISVFSQVDKESKTVLISGNEAIFRGLIESGIGFASMYPGTPVSEVGDLLYEWSMQIDKAGQLDNPRFIFDYAINELVSIEEAIGASWSGVRSAVMFKHVGMNVAADALHTIMYSGIGGVNGAGMVIICGGDPQSASSTNAEDIRLFSLHSKLPILFPATVNELYQFTKLAFDLSETIDLPVMLYTTPKLSFAAGKIVLGKLPEIMIKPNIDIKDEKRVEFKRQFSRYINAIHYAQLNHQGLISKIDALENHGFIFDLKSQSESKRLDNIVNQILHLNTGNVQSVKDPKRQSTQKKSASKQPETNPQTKNVVSTQLHKIAIISGGLPYTLLNELLDSQYIDYKIPILKINLLYPLNRKEILSFIEGVKPDKLLVIEELEPFIENAIKNILFDNAMQIIVEGKKYFSKTGEITLQILKNGLDAALQLTVTDKYQNFNQSILEIKKEIPIREPTFCPGCSHRNVFYALRKASDELKKSKNIDVVVGGDIGCYTMGMSEPYRGMDWLICMGAGIGIMNGVARVTSSIKDSISDSISDSNKVNKQHIVGVIGDSTFFHCGIQGLLNLLKQDINGTVIILNNFYVAMTGHQPTLTSDPAQNPNSKIKNLVGFQNEQFKLQDFLTGMGVKDLSVIDGYDIQKLKELFIKKFNTYKEQSQQKDSPNSDGNSGHTQVILVNSECALMKHKREFSKDISAHNLVHKTYYQISTSCPKCNECFLRLACTAIKQDTDEEGHEYYFIDEEACMGEFCGSCVDICPNHCILTTLINPVSKSAIKKQGEGNK